MANVAGLNLCAQLSTASIPDYRGTPVAGYKKAQGGLVYDISTA